MTSLLTLLVLCQAPVERPRRETVQRVVIEPRESAQERWEQAVGDFIRQQEIKQREWQDRKRELLKQFRADADQIKLEALVKIKKESEENKRWLRAQAAGQKALASITAREAKRLMDIPEVKTWIAAEARYRQMERRLK